MAVLDRNTMIATVLGVAAAAVYVWDDAGKSFQQCDQEFENTDYSKTATYHINPLFRDASTTDATVLTLLDNKKYRGIGTAQDIEKLKQQLPNAWACVGITEIDPDKSYSHSYDEDGNMVVYELEDHEAGSSGDQRVIPVPE